MKRNKLLAGALAALMAMGALAGCRGGTQPGGEQGGAAAPTAESPVHISYKSLAWIKAEQDETIAIINEWNEAHPEIQVEYVQGDWGTVDQELLTSFETGDVPDIFQYWTAPIMLWKERGFLADLSPMLDSEMKGDVNEDVWGLFTTGDDKVIAVPFQSEVDMVYYNVDLFAQKGIAPPTLDNPWTLDEMIEAARQLNDPDNGVKGIAISGLNWAARFFNDSWATKANLSPLVIDGDSYALQLDGAYQALLEKMRGIADEGLMDPAIFGEGYELVPAFMDGEIAILAGMGCFTRSQFIHELSDRDTNWGMIPPIKIENTATYGAIQTLSIPEKSGNKEAAMEFLQWFWNTDNQERIAQAAYIFPGRNSAMERFDKAEEGWDMAYQSASNLIIPNYVPVPGWGTFMEGTGKTIYQEYMIGQISYEEFTRKLNDQLLPFLEESR